MNNIFFFLKNSLGADKFCILIFVFAALFFCYKDVFAAPVGTVNPDDNRPEDQYQVDLFGQPLTIGGEYEFEPVYREDYSLGSKPDDSTKLEQKIEIEMFYPLSEYVALYVEGKYKHKKDFQRDDGKEETKSFVERGETWIQFDRVFERGFSARLGRQNFSDKREWWWDEDLDAIRFFYTASDVLVEYALAKELGRVSSEKKLHPEDKDIQRLFGRIKWMWATKQRLELFWLTHDDKSSRMIEDEVVSSDDEDEVDADLTWYGLRFMGRIKQKPVGRFSYWIDAGYVHGKEIIVDFDDIDESNSVVDEADEYDVEGWGIDVGVTWLSSLPSALHLTLGYAKGSGDKDSDNVKNKNYQQTGLHDNNHKFDSVNSFKYYGELLRPELSNIAITTLAVGFSVLNNSSIEMLYHDYRQVYAADRIRGSKLRIRPGGDSRAIGSEIDLLLGLEEWNHWELEFMFGLFKAGKAFGADEGDIAKTGVFKLNYNF